MDAPPPALPPLLPRLAAVPDPRRPRGRRHPLGAILALSCAAMLAGGDSLLAVAEWGRDPAGGAPLGARPGFTRAQTPCVAPLPRVFRRLDVAAGEAAVGAWAAAVGAALPPPGPRRPAAPRGLAVDGKALRGSAGPGGPAARRLSALGHDRGGVLAQAPVGAADEAGALPALLADLVLDGRVLTCAAAFTDRAAAAAGRERGGAA